MATRLHAACATTVALSDSAVVSHVPGVGSTAPGFTSIAWVGRRTWRPTVGSGRLTGLDAGAEEGTARHQAQRQGREPA